MMHDPVTAEVWQTAFGKDFGIMAQGDIKTGQKGMNAMFVMTHDKIAHAIREKKLFTFANPIVDYRLEKGRSALNMDHGERGLGHIRQRAQHQNRKY
jgi:hypothetical protein